MDYDQTLDALNIQLGDSGNVTFTPEEKTRCLTKAWNDAYVVKTVWDTSLTFAYSTYQYPVPSSLDVILDVYMSVSNSNADEPRKVNGSLWEVVDGNLQFKNNANGIIPTGYTLYLKGSKKLNPASDTLDTVDLQEYVIALAGVNTLSTLGFKKANLFLKNDLTMGELITLRREFKQEVIELRGKLKREFQTV